MESAGALGSLGGGEGSSRLGRGSLNRYVGA